MRLHNLAAAFLFSPVLIFAHFTLLEPRTVYTVPNSPATISPCGYSTLNSLNITNTGITGNPATFLNILALTTHGSAIWTFRFILDPFEFDLSAGVALEPGYEDLYRTVQTTGDGKFCLTNAGVSENMARLWREEGDTESYKKQGWVSVKGEMDDGTFYQCAHVFVQSEVPLIWPTICANDTGVSVRYKDGDGTDDGTTSTATGPSVGPALPTRTRTDIAPSMSGAPIDNTSATWSASTTASTDTSTSTGSPAVVSEGAAAGLHVNNSLGFAGLSLVLGTMMVGGLRLGLS